MDENLNTLQIQELLDQCIEFLRDSPSDLIACALVSRSWTFAAQLHLFREVQIKSISSPNLWPRLQETLRSSPHLIRHIRRLRFNSEAVSLTRVFEICEFPFTHLQHVSIRHTNTPLPAGLPIPHLLSLPTLTHAKIVAQFSDPSSFLQLWERCSPKLRHIDLYCFQRSDLDALPIQTHRFPPVALESLKIRSIKYIGNWLANDLCPLDLSKLKVLSIIHGLEEVLQWPRFAPALRTLQALDFIPRVSTQRLDLSVFPNLLLIRLGGATGTEFKSSLDVLSMIAAPSRVQKIIIWNSYLDGACCEQLDAKFASLPVDPLPILELEISTIRGGPTVDTLVNFFPHIMSLNLLRHVEHRDNWFETWQVYNHDVSDG
ncbi:hypothetical protein FB451DRAFT_464683 [Mycena latifolia]|nr:hypothetical protein FB451DRAFT_464683 [Mycena latifolia]